MRVLAFGLVLGAALTANRADAQTPLPGIAFKLGQPRTFALRTRVAPLSNQLSAGLDSTATLSCPMPVLVPTIPELGRMPVIRPSAPGAFLLSPARCANPLFDLTRLPAQRRPTPER